MSNKIEIPEYTGGPIDLEAHGIRYGFRRDPMEWVENDKSLEGSKARTLVFSQPKPGDQVLLDQAIERLLEKQQEDGSILGDPAAPLLTSTVSRLQRILELGCSPDRPEARKAVGYLVSQLTEQSLTPNMDQARLFCRLGPDEHPELRDTGLRELAAECEEGLRWWGWCPWGYVRCLQTLWDGRHFVDTEAGLVHELTWLAEGMNAAGGISSFDPFGIVLGIGTIGHPLARQALVKMVPMLLRAEQWRDGGGGDSTFHVLRALVRHGLLDKLRSLPPLPPDWRVVRSIPAPDGDLHSMTWGNDLLWVYDRGEQEAVGVSPEDGQVVRSVAMPVPNVQSIAWWDDALAAGVVEPDRIIQIAPDTGEIRREIPLTGDMTPHAVVQVGDKLWSWTKVAWAACVIDPEGPLPAERRDLIIPAAWTWGGVPYLAAAPDGVWQGSGMLMKMDRDHTPLIWDDATFSCRWQTGETATANDVPNARLLDWGEVPFGNALRGIAQDGQNLWALDADEKRICIIEKTESGQEITAALTAGDEAGQ